jgi:glycerate kinase
MAADEQPDAFAAGIFAGSELIAVGLVAPDGEPGSWRIRGMATSPHARGGGAGTAVLEALVEHARRQDAVHVWCNARTPARSLYERAGLRVASEEFELPGIGPHFVMEMTVPSPALREGVLVAPDAFKGTIGALEVAAAIAKGIRSGGLAAEECPVADGGEGTMAVLLAALGGELHTAASSDPLGRPLRARWGLLSDGHTAIIESAQASGLALLDVSERDAERASSAGTGELMLAAAAAGASRILVAVGGTASTDGGAGALAAIQNGGGLGDVELVALGDVEVSFEHAAQAFAPQKGADADSVSRLSLRLDDLARAWPRDPRGVAMTGAGGGLAGGLWAALDAELCSGAEFVLDALGFQARLRGRVAVVIGEGRLDEQSLLGKIAGAVARRASAQQVPLHAIVGASALSRPEQDRLGLSSVREAGDLVELARAGETLARELAAVTVDDGDYQREVTTLRRV